ncbi:putative GP46 protein [Yersinia frederiksenii]|nr:putative GP46 protein [Yersinia frederiksenii]
MLRQNCALRRPQREPYDMDEYITMLIRKDNAELQAQLKEQVGRKCGKCGDTLPGDLDGCMFIRDSECWQHVGWHETKLSI